jgi:polyisoprenoid-binding protein YceI
MRKFFAVLAIWAAVSAPAFAAERYLIDPSHSSVGFKVKHMMVSKVPGKFTKFDGQFHYDEKDVSLWKASVTIDVASIDTGDPNRDTHLKSADFFDVEKYPVMTFKSTRASDLVGNKAKLEGMLTLKGISKPVVLDVEVGGLATDPWGNKRAGFEATTKLNRKDFGINWNKALETGGLVVGDEVEITLAIEGIEKKETPEETKQQMKKQNKLESKPAKKKQ